MEGFHLQWGSPQAGTATEIQCFSDSQGCERTEAGSKALPRPCSADEVS